MTEKFGLGQVSETNYLIEWHNDLYSVSNDNDSNVATHVSGLLLHYYRNKWPTS